MFAEAELKALRLLAVKRVAFFMCRSKCAEALEKLIKAELVHRGWALVRTHDLQRLVDELRNRSSPHAGRLQPLAEELADYYFAGRYPGFDLEEPEDWSALVMQIKQIGGYGRRVKADIMAKARPGKKSGGAKGK